MNSYEIDDDKYFIIFGEDYVRTDFCFLYLIIDDVLDNIIIFLFI